MELEILGLVILAGGGVVGFWQARRKARKNRAANLEAEIQEWRQRLDEATARHGQAANEASHLEHSIGEESVHAKQALKDWENEIKSWTNAIENYASKARLALRTRSKTDPDDHFVKTSAVKCEAAEARVNELLACLAHVKETAPQKTERAEDALTQARAGLRNCELETAVQALDEAEAMLGRARQALEMGQFYRAHTLAESVTSRIDDAWNAKRNEQLRLDALATLKIDIGEVKARLNVICTKVLPTFESRPDSFDSLIDSTEGRLELTAVALEDGDPERCAKYLTEAEKQLASLEEMIEDYEAEIEEERRARSPFGTKIPQELQDLFIATEKLVGMAVKKHKSHCVSCGGKPYPESHHHGLTYILFNSNDVGKYYTRPLNEARRLLNDPTTAQLAVPIMMELKCRAEADLARGPDDRVVRTVPKYDNSGTQLP